MTATPPPLSPLKNFAEAAAFLGVSESWLRKEVAARRVPHTRFGSRVLFSDRDLTRLVERNAVEPGPSAAAAVLRARHGRPA